MSDTINTKINRASSVENFNRNPKLDGHREFQSPIKNILANRPSTREALYSRSANSVGKHTKFQLPRIGRNKNKGASSILKLCTQSLAGEFTKETQTVGKYFINSEISEN